MAKLKPWNQETYDEIVELYSKGERKVAISQATGTGKSSIISKIVKNIKGSAVVLYPNENIENQFMNTYNLHKPTYISYQKLTSMNKRGEIEEFKDMFSVIVADEIHHLGAELWGPAFEKLVELNPKAKVLGATATPRRTDQTESLDIIDLMFDGNRVGNLTLSKAIVEKILPSPIYNIGIYSIKEEIDKRINKIKGNNKISESDKNTLYNFLNDKNLDWENSEGLDKTVEKSFGILKEKESVKIVVFCPNIESIKELREVMLRAFIPVFSGRNIKLLEYHNKVNNNDFDYFVESEDNNIKLLFVVNKLNEGIHLDSLDGGIMLRQTDSHIVFFQQLGRFLSYSNAEIGHKPIILDLVNNFNSINIVKELEEDIDRDARIRRESISDGDSKDEIELVFNTHTANAISILSEIDDEIDSLSRDVFEFNGGYYIVSELADILDIPIKELNNYIYRKKMDIYAIEKIINLNKHKHGVNGEYMTKEEFSKKFEVPIQIVNVKMSTDKDLQEIYNEIFK